MAETRMMTYGEFADAIGRSLPAGRSICLRKGWKRVIGNDGKTRVAVPVEALTKPPRKHTLPEAQPEALPAAPPEAHPEAPEVRADARVLLALLEAHVSELRGELKDARVLIADLSAKAGRVDVMAALLQSERERLAEVRAERDRLLDRLTAAPAAPARRAWWPVRRSV